MKRRIPRGARPTQLQVSAHQEHVLERIIRRAKSPQSLVTRAKLVLQAATPARNAHISADLQISLPAVRTWRQRWPIVSAATEQLQEVEAVADESVLEAHIVAVLSDQPRPGTPTTFSAEQICQIICQYAPNTGTTYMRPQCTTPVATGQPVVSKMNEYTINPLSLSVR